MATAIHIHADIRCPLRILAVTAALACASWAGAANPNLSKETNVADQGSSLSNGYIRADQEGTRVVSLRADATGSKLYGMELAAAGGIGPVTSARANGRTLIIEPAGSEFTWSIPFDRTGYYDADTHINYPSPKTTAGAYPLILPFRKFVTSAGQTVFVEHFKRLPKGVYFLDFNIDDGSQILFRGDVTQNYDLKVTWPGQTQVVYEISDSALTFKSKTSGKPVTIEVMPRGKEEIPGGNMLFPKVSFEPDPVVCFEPTGKRASASALLNDFLQMAVYWPPRVTCGGDWGLGAAETHMLNDPRSWHLRKLRFQLLYQLGFIGYDRFEHFGCMYAWERMPDYGAGGLLNVPPGNAPYDMRMLHLNGQWVQTIASYVLATGDTDFLSAKRARWLATDGNEPQPLCGIGAATSSPAAMVRDFVLAAGDVRLDKRPPEIVHSLGQSFTAAKPFRKIMIRLGTDAKPKEQAEGAAILRKGIGGAELQKFPIVLKHGEADHTVTLELSREYEPGTYFVEITDNDSGKRYFGPGICWWTDPETKYAAGEATSGPFQGSVLDRLKLLVEYMRKNMGAERENLAYYINSPEYNVAGQKSGRPGVSMQNSFWESLGGGYDAFEGIWYNAACKSLAELCELVKQDKEVERYREYARLADDAYNQKYWYTVTENGRKFSRYFACQDWDGVVHDYGFTYYNLEAAARGISTREQARKILWWLDRGFWSPDGGAYPQLISNWNKHIYSVWQIAPPFNTIGNTTWLNITGTLPYMEVVANGGTRLNPTARELVLRARYLSPDNMHERNKQVLARFANPDRLTGGRTFDDPGGRGRWHFGEPDKDRADIEGFREIFPTNGDIAPAEIMAYLGMEFSTKGLWLRPRAPSELNRITLQNIGYAGATLDFVIEAQRDFIEPQSVETSLPLTCVFTAPARFNKAGVKAAVKPFKTRHDAQMTLALDQLLDDGSWSRIVETWRNHVQDGEWQWVGAEKWLDPGKKYRLSVYDLDAREGETVNVALDDHGLPMLRLAAEKTALTITVGFNPKGRQFQLVDDSGKPVPGNTMRAVMDPGQRVRLTTEVFR
ncbi:MAG: hypothetical protein WCK47_05245 [bacterium]